MAVGALICNRTLRLNGERVSYSKAGHSANSECANYARSACLGVVLAAAACFPKMLPKVRRSHSETVVGDSNFGWCYFYFNSWVKAVSISMNSLSDSVECVLCVFAQQR